jgi:hypothetical protein
MDLFGPVAYISICGNKYGLVIIDDYSRFTWMFFLQDKSETQEVLNKFLIREQNCHTPFREIGNEASIRVSRMFKSHA